MLFLYAVMNGADHHRYWPNNQGQGHKEEEEKQFYNCWCQIPCPEVASNIWLNILPLSFSPSLTLSFSFSQYVCILLFNLNLSFIFSLYLSCFPFDWFFLHYSLFFILSCAISDLIIFHSSYSLIARGDLELTTNILGLITT